MTHLPTLSPLPPGRAPFPRAVDAHLDLSGRGAALLPRAAVAADAKVAYVRQGRKIDAVQCVSPSAKNKAGDSPAPLLASWTFGGAGGGGGGASAAASEALSPGKVLAGIGLIVSKS